MIQNNIIRFNSDYKDHTGYQFLFGQEYQYVDKYTGRINVGNNGDVCFRNGIVYRILIGTTYHHIPETVVVEASAKDISYNNDPEKNINEVSTAKTWNDEQKTDEIEKLGENDYVKAAKEYLGKSIGAKKIQDQADYSINQ